MNVVVEIVDEVISFTSGDQSLGSWPLEDVEIEVKSDGFHLTFEDEEIVLTVTDPAGFANSVSIDTHSDQRAEEPAVINGEPVLATQDGARKGTGLSGRLESVSPEEKFADVIERVAELKTALTDDAITPQDVFGRWLRMLREINMRLGQGAMPTPLYYRLNSELLDLIPVPPRSPRPEQQTVGAGTTA